MLNFMYLQFLQFSPWLSCSHDTWSFASLDGYSNGLKEKRFGMSVTQGLDGYALWQYELWSFLNGGYKIRKFFAKDSTSSKEII